MIEQVHTYLERLVSQWARDVDEKSVTGVLDRIAIQRSSFGDKIIPHVRIEPHIS
jgi:hypothetical protein